jgi:integrase
MAKQPRQYGTGSIYPNPRNPKRLIGEILLDGKRRRVSGTTKTDVEAKLRALTAKAAAGDLLRRRVTVAEITETFITRIVPNLTHNGRPISPSTRGVYTWAGEIITDELGSKKVDALTVEDVEAMLDRLAKRGLSKASLWKVRSKLAQIIELAVERDHARRNVAKKAELTPTAAPAKKRTALQPDEARTLLEALRDERNGAMYALGLRVGLRPGEAAGLFWDDLDLDAEIPTANVTRGVQRDGGLVDVSDDLKTEGSKRTLGLPLDLARWLGEHRRQQITERLAAGRWLDERLVFATPTGHITDPKRNRTDLARICDRAGVPRVLPNELRHSCASLLADEGVSNELIADLLGHTTTRMVERTYKHRLRPVVSVATVATWAESQ